MRVEVHTLNRRGEPVLAGAFELRGGCVECLAEPGYEETLANIVHRAKVRDPLSPYPYHAHTEPAKWLAGLHTHLRTPYLRATEATHE